MALKNYLTLIIFGLLTICETYSQSILTNPICLTRTDNSIIKYYLELKENDVHSETLFTIIQGSDCNSVRNIASIEKLKNIYSDADVLTVEKYGIDGSLSYSDMAERSDCPEGYIGHDNPKQRCNDLDQVISTLRNEYGYRTIFIIGGSEGALVANMLTINTDYIDATILFGGGGRFFIDDVIHSMNFAIDSEDKRQENIEGFKILSAYILSHDAFEISMSNHGYSWWRIMLSMDQLELLRSIETPVLILQGGLDKAVSPTLATELVELLRDEGKDNIDYFFYPDYDHSLNLSVDGDSSRQVIKDANEWLLKIID